MKLHESVCCKTGMVFKEYCYSPNLHFLVKIPDFSVPCLFWGLWGLVVIPSWTQESTSKNLVTVPNGTGQASSRSIICDAGKVPEVAGGLTGVFAHGMLEYLYIYIYIIKHIVPYVPWCSSCAMMIHYFLIFFFKIMCHVSKCSRNAPGAD